jgi:hypothetical protein
MRLSVAVSAELGLTRELLRRPGVGLRSLFLRTGQGARRGWSLWTRTMRSLVRSRVGVIILVVEMLLLDVLFVTLSWLWGGQPAPSGLFVTFFEILPLAALAVFLLPALAFVGGAILWALLKRHSP